MGNWWPRSRSHDNHARFATDGTIWRVRLLAHVNRIADFERAVEGSGLETDADVMPNFWPGARNLNNHVRSVAASNGKIYAISLVAYADPMVDVQRAVDKPVDAASGPGPDWWNHRAVEEDAAVGPHTDDSMPGWWPWSW